MGVVRFELVRGLEAAVAFSLLQQLNGVGGG